ncbi:MAG: UvrD-helicase domain-containing protein, partial [Clostridiales bacterium]|nr:UvrD-helicase domain-containing protein [Clostridiales bacterium]
SRYRYINIDEFQDTTQIQLEIVRHLCSEHNNIFVVGDEDQSIYGWRGAEIKNILDFSRHFPNARHIKLEQNYRSTTPILSAANNVIKHNLSRKEKVLWTAREGGEPIVLYEASSDRDESAYVCKKISYLVNNGYARYKDIAVLVRVNSLTRLFEEDFNLHGIPYRIFGGFKFFERKEIKIFLSYLQLSVNPKDGIAFMRTVNNPKRGIGETTVEKLKAFADEKGVSMAEAVNIIDECDTITPSTRNKLIEFKKLIDDLCYKAPRMKASEFAKYTLEVSGLKETLNSGTEEDRSRYENMLEFVGAITLFEESFENATLEDFLQYVSLMSDTDNMSDDNYVTIATIHMVKGLEFGTVFAVALEEGIFPSSMSMMSGDIEEERRLIYVAITRAKDRFFATWSKSRSRFNDFQYNPKSRFIEEMCGDVTPFAKPKPASVTAPGALKTNSYGSDYTKSSITQQSGQGQKDYSKFEPGKVVEHVKFGEGIITEVAGEGDNMIAAIMFKGLGIKRFALSVAYNLLKIKE